MKLKFVVCTAVLMILCIMGHSGYAEIANFAESTLDNETGGVISGTVISESEGLPVASLLVTACPLLDSPCIKATTSADGTYSMNGLIPAEYVISVNTAGTAYAPEYYDNAYDWYSSTPALVTSGGITEINFNLKIGGTITGVVINDADGKPVASVNVNACFLENYGSCEDTTTEADGSYIISRLAPGSYRLSVSSYGTEHLFVYYENVFDGDSATPIAIAAGETVSNIDFRLIKGGKISGLVTSEADGRPLASLEVEACATENDDRCQNATTGADGTYRITGLIPGSYEMFVETRETEYAPEYYDNAYNENFATPVIVTAGQDSTNIDFSLAVSGIITGTVTSKADGRPLASVRVQACSTELDLPCEYASTKADGTYRITGLVPGSHIVSASPYGTEFLPESYSDAAFWWSATPVVVTLGQATGNIDFDLSKGGAITGIIIAETTGQPIASLFVRACPVSGLCGNATTDAAGTYSIDGLAPGSYRVHVSADGTDYASAYFGSVFEKTFALPVLVVEGQVTADIDFELIKGGTIAGAVTGEADDRPIASLRVWAGTAGGGLEEAYTGSDGTYRISGLAPGSYRVCATTGHTDYAPECFENADDWDAAVPVIVTAGQTTANIDIGLGKGGQITGTITSAADDQPIASQRIEAFRAEGTLGGWTDTYSGPDGSYIISGLASGSYKVCVITDDTDYAPECFENAADRSSAAPVVVAAGQIAANIDFALAKGGKISGVVTRKTDGAPIEGVKIIAGDYVSGDYRGRAISSTDGSYSISRLPAGSYRLQAAHDGFRHAPQYFNNALTYGSAAAVELAAGRTATDIDFQLTEIPAVYKGDFNRDGQLDLADIVLALDFSVNGASGSVNPGIGEVNGDGKIGLAEALYASQVVAGVRQAASPLKIDGVISPGEWEDARTAEIAIAADWTVRVFYKHDETNLYFAFTNPINPAGLEMYAEVFLDLNNDKSASWKQDDWWLHAGHGECDGKGTHSTWENCSPEKIGWSANKYSMNPPGAMEFRVEYEKLGLVPGETKTIGIAFNLVDGYSIPPARHFWPASVQLDNPSTWGEWELK